VTLFYTLAPRIRRDKQWHVENSKPERFLSGLVACGISEKETTRVGLVSRKRRWRRLAPGNNLLVSANRNGFSTADVVWSVQLLRALP
jgi:hypothetical protein